MQPSIASFGIRRRGAYTAFVAVMLAMAIAVPLIAGISKETWWGVLVPLAILVAMVSDMREAVTRVEIAGDALLVQTFLTSRRIERARIRSVAVQPRRMFRGGTMADVLVTLDDGSTLWIKPRFVSAEEVARAAQSR